MNRPDFSGDCRWTGRVLSSEEYLRADNRKETIWQIFCCGRGKEFMQLPDQRGLCAVEGSGALRRSVRSRLSHSRKSGLHHAAWEQSPEISRRAIYGKQPLPGCSGFLPPKKKREGGFQGQPIDFPAGFQGRRGHHLRIARISRAELSTRSAPEAVNASLLE